MRSQAIPTVAVLALTLAACTADPRPKLTIETAAGPVNVRVEIVNTPAARQRGLMFRDDLGENDGMLFVFEDERKRSFWMKNTPLPLDIIYIAADGVIDSIASDTKPYSTKPLPSAGPARFVLEVHAGFSSRHGLEPGQTVKLPDRIEPVILQ